MKGADQLHGYHAADPVHLFSCIQKAGFLVIWHIFMPATCKKAKLRPRFSTLPRDLPNVNEWKIMFDPL